MYTEGMWGQGVHVAKTGRFRKQTWVMFCLPSHLLPVVTPCPSFTMDHWHGWKWEMPWDDGARTSLGNLGRCREFKAETSLLVEWRESSGGWDVWRSKCLWTAVCKDHQVKSWEMGPVVGSAGASLSGGRSLGLNTAQLNRIIYADTLSIVRIIEGWQVVGFQVEPC